MRIISLNKNMSFSPFSSGSSLKKTSKTVESKAEIHSMPYYKPLFFKGKADKITKATSFSKEGQERVLEPDTLDGSYLLDEESGLKLIYGKNAIDYLNNISEFEYDTQVIFPKGSKATILKDGKKIDVGEDSGLCLDAGTKAKVILQKGFPAVFFVKNKYDWYKPYSKSSEDENIRNKFLEAIYFNSNHYNGAFFSDIFLPIRMRNEEYLKKLGINKWQEKNKLIDTLFSKRDMLSQEDRIEIEKIKSLVQRLYENGVLLSENDGFVKFRDNYSKDFFEKKLKEQGFSEEEILFLSPFYDNARRLKIDTRYVIKSPIEGIDIELAEKMRDKDILYKNKKYKNDYVYWKKSYPNADILRNELLQKDFSQEEIDKILSFWLNSNITGYDFSGLKYIDDDMSLYNLQLKTNFWNSEKSCWLTSSMAPASGVLLPSFFGVSLIDTPKKGVVKMSDLRTSEVLHKHSDEQDKKQTEIYLITSGKAAFTILKNGIPETKILNEGELFVVEPGALHCINSVLGEYEHLCTQLPSAFQYGYGFKISEKMPQGYTDEEITKQAFEKLNS